MARNTILVLLAALTLVSIEPAQAQQQSKIARIGWLSTRPASWPGGGSDVIRRELHELGYIEGKHIVFEDRFTEGNLDRLPALAAELVRLKVDVLLTPTPPAALAAKNATRTIPIVFNRIADPVGLGLVDSMARPGRNITGVTNIASELTGKRLEILKETHSKAHSRCSAVESARSTLWAPMGRRPTGGKGTEAAASFHGGKQRRQIRGCVQRSN